MPELDSVTWGNITEDSVITKTKTDNGVSTTNNSKTTTITYKDGSAELDERGFATLNTKIKVPTRITLKDDTGLEKNIAVRYSVNGIDKGLVKSAALASHNITISNLDNSGAEHTFGLDLTVAAAQKAIAEDGYITGTFTVVYDVYNTKAAGYNADLTQNTAKPIATVTETVIIKVEASSLTLTDTSKNEVWNVSIAEAYKATLSTETEENKTTEGNKKDDVPKTGEVIPMVLVGFIIISVF